MRSRWQSVLGSLLFLVAAPGTVVGVIPYLISRWQLEAPLLGIPAGRVVGGLLLVCGVALLLDSFARFAWEGRGTPAPVGPTESLVASGLYRHVRNPMYLAVVASIAGQALLLGNGLLLGYAAGVFLVFHGFVVLYEEPSLRRRFGASYESYCATARRWWPRLRPARSPGQER